MEGSSSRRGGMVCSGKGGGSNWVDRLRSSKGFPIPDNVLDSSSSASAHPPPPPPPPPQTDISENPKPAAPSPFSLITGILSDLFYITPSSSVSASASASANKIKNKKNKFPRKQSNPKILPNPNQLPPPPPPPILSSSNSHIPHRHSPHHQPHKQQQQQLLSGFSKTHLTVIDTSSHLWKSDKLVFRRKHVWKIRDPINNNNNYYKTNFSPSQQHRRFPSNLPPQHIQEYNAEHCSGPEMSANAPDSSNDGKEKAFTPLQGNGSYDPEQNVIS